MSQFLDLTNKTILVVGATGGIGFETCIRLSKFGANIIAVGRNEKQLSKLSDSIKDSLLKVYSIDLFDINSIDTIFEDFKNNNYRLDGLVFVAGIGDLYPVKNIDYDKELKVFKINYFSFIEFVKQSTKRGMYNEGFRIVGVSSVASLFGEKAHCIYSGSKGAMDASVRAMAKELSSKGIAINTIAPGITRTNMTENFNNSDEIQASSVDRTLDRQYLGVLDPLDVANGVCFLLSRASRMITGITLPLDGGFSTSC